MNPMNMERHYFKIGDKEIPIQTLDGTTPTEQQITLIKNVLIDDFLVNDDTTGGAEQTFPSIAMDGSGNFVIVWEDYRNGHSDIYLQKYNSNGTLQGINIKVNDDLGTAEQGSSSISMDVSGNFVVVWRDKRNGHTDIYFQRYNSNGIAQDINTKVNDDDGTAGQYSPSIAMDDSGNFVVVWSDYRNGNADIYLQRYNSCGITQGVNTKVNDDAGTASQYNPFIAMNGIGNFVVVWKDLRNGNYDIYLQRYNSSGIAQGVNTKVNDDAGTTGQYNPSIAMDGSGNFVVVWMDYRYSINNPDVIGQRYNADGSPRGTNYRIVADGPNYGEIHPVVSANSSQIVFAWMDNRRSKGWDIYAKIAGWDWDGVTSVLSEKNVPTEFALLQNYPNPFNPSTTIRFELPEKSEITLKIYDLLGNEIRTLISGTLEAGYHSCSWDGKNQSGKDVASGVYLYSLKTKNFFKTMKLILLR